MSGQNYGYDEDMEGVLRPQKLPTKDSTIGPAYYNVMHVCGTPFRSLLHTCMHTTGKLDPSLSRVVVQFTMYAIVQSLVTKMFVLESQYGRTSLLLTPLGPQEVF